MSVDGWRSVLVLGGIRSGKSEFAESLVGEGGPVRYVATGSPAGPRGDADDDPDWDARVAAHRERRPAAWPTEETGADPTRLLEIISGAKEGETLLVDDLGGWVTGLIDPERQPADDVAAITDLASAVRDSAARLILVTSEVGLSLVPLTTVGRAYTDALGTTNRAVADAADAVALVVAGQVTWLKQAAPASAPVSAPVEAAPVVPETSPEVLTPAPTPTADAAAGADGQPGWAAATMTLPALATGLVIQQGMALPMPDEFTPAQAHDRLPTLDLGGAGFGKLQKVVEFAAATQGRPDPRPWRSPRVVLIRGDHNGGAAAGTLPGESRRLADQARAGEGPLARLAAEAGATLQVVDATACAAMEEREVLALDEVESALRYGWRLAEEASDAGVDLLVVGACGAGSAAAAAAVLAATTGAEPAAVLGRVVVPGAEIDDDAWMIRCAAVRDAMHRVRRNARSAKQVLADLGGGDIAVATGLILGATARRVPVLLDGPVGVAAALVTRDLAGQARHWCLLPDHGEDPAVKLGADVLGLTPLLDLRLGLGEGATALAALPLLRTALSLAATLPVHPAVAPDDETLAAHDSLDEPESPAGLPPSAWPADPATTATPTPATADPTPATADPTPAAATAADAGPAEPVPAQRDAAGENGHAPVEPEPAPSALESWFDSAETDKPARGA
ncbi:bifunctional adenosylcobinamide kinase/adenosylcobinamide-phosphate guanylyltransferase [Asanoa sp. NPDC050611]|uniref:bifunctional adenosylcobinamide kinase/adenosylcobinamide-phosphate guanylyltransferase n=1 Tax=Asanoa sp. NPDC050611 TaxID=3157098 RepID=UPI003408EDDC